MHDASRRVLLLLETVEVPLRSAVQEAVAIILAPIMAVAVDCADSGERRSQMSQRPKVEITRARTSVGGLRVYRVTVVKAAVVTKIRPRYDHSTTYVTTVGLSVCGLLLLLHVALCSLNG